MIEIIPKQQETFYIVFYLSRTRGIVNAEQ